MILSEQIKLCRKQLGMSQADLADAIWVSRNTVSNWERGDTTPDIQSLVLMGALFGRSLDEIVKGDEQVMAQVLERDKNHLIIAGEASDIGGEQPDSRNHATILNLFGLRSTGGPAHGKFGDADVTDPYGLAYRLVRVATLFSRGLYHILDEHGCKVGSITRKHALQHPVFQVRMKGFDRVQLRRETRIDNGYKDVIRFDGGGRRGRQPHGGRVLDSTKQQRNRPHQRTSGPQPDRIWHRNRGRCFGSPRTRPDVRNLDAPRLRPRMGARCGQSFYLNLWMTGGFANCGK